MTDGKANRSAIAALLACAQCAVFDGATAAELPDLRELIGDARSIARQGGEHTWPGYADAPFGVRATSSNVAYYNNFFLGSLYVCETF